MPTFSRPSHKQRKEHGEHRELRADGGQQGLETLPHKQGPPTGLREGLARAQEAAGPKCRP